MIPETLLQTIKEEYKHFKQTERYRRRKQQLKFAEMAKKIIQETTKKEEITMDDLTSLLRMFHFNCTKDTFKNKLKNLAFKPEFEQQILQEYETNQTTGYTGGGKGSIGATKKLDTNQLQDVKMFLQQISQAQNKEQIQQIITDFESKNIPEIKMGIYSPWLHYLQPTICPIVTGNAKDTIKKMGWNGKKYIESWDYFEKLNQTIGEENYGYLDSFLDENKNIFSHKTKEPMKYWLFIIPKTYEDGKLWQYCKNSTPKIAAMQYQVGKQKERVVTININEIKKIKQNHKIVVYLNDKIVGCIAKVTREFYENTKKDNGFNGEFGQRIEIQPFNEKYEIDISPIFKELHLNQLHTKTIHEISKETYEKIFSFILGGDIEINTLLEKKKQIILYGPPGTGKTYATKKIAQTLIGGVE